MKVTAPALQGWARSGGIGAGKETLAKRYSGDLWDGMVFDFRWSVSRGRDTYGYNICSLWINGEKVSSCDGGGYDMQGTALGRWIAAQFPEEIKNLPKYDSEKREGFYGITSYGIDGGTGFSCMQDIMRYLGWDLKYVPTRRKNDSMYTLTKIDPVTDPRKRWH